jgi:hypothetical protein
MTLTELGHTQPATPIRTYNSTAFGILNETIKKSQNQWTLGTIGLQIESAKNMFIGQLLLLLPEKSQHNV